MGVTPQVIQIAGQQTFVDVDQPSELTIELAAHAELEHFAVVGLGQLRKRVHFKLADGARLRTTTVVAGSGRDAIAVDYLIHHQGRSSRADTLVKGVLAEAATAEIFGLIRIDPAAQLTESFLEQRALLLSDAAKANLQPKLEIAAHEVKASHAATVGPLDPEQLFYAQSRGLTAQAAQQIIVQAFLADAISHLPPSDERQALIEQLGRKLSLPIG